MNIVSERNAERNKSRQTSLFAEKSRRSPEIGLWQVKLFINKQRMKSSKLRRQKREYWNEKSKSLAMRVK